jgi:Protein of unknown function (DUF5818)
MVPLLIALGAASLAAAQDQNVRPQVPEDAFSTRELIAWSSMQKPQPAPQPLPPPDKPIPQPDQQRSNTGEQQSTSTAASQAETTRTFIGKILKMGGSYVLQVDEATTYKLANGGDVARFENKNVKVEGALDSQNNIVHVTRISAV